MKRHLIGVVLLLSLPLMTAHAGGPIRSMTGGKCIPLESQPELCREAGERWLVMKADGSGTMVMGFVRSSPTYKDMKKISKKFGGKRERIPESKCKKDWGRKHPWGLIEANGASPVEPAAYQLIIPISDKFAIAQPYKDIDCHWNDEYYLVEIDSKLKKLKEPLGKGRTYYTMGGYSMQSPVRVFIARGTTSVGDSTVKFEQLGPDGRVVATYDNIIFSQAKLTFYTQNESGLIFAKAIDPKTGNEASVRWGPMGDFLGYYPKIDIIESIYDLDRKKFTNYLMQAVGRLPLQTDLPDHTLYVPLDEQGEPVKGPKNFVGMTPLYDNYWGFNERQKKYKDWLLVYKTPTGFSYKIAGLATRGQVKNNSESSPISILASEADYVMLADFDYQREEGAREYKSNSDIWQSYFIQFYTAYEADGVTPKPSAYAGKWHSLSPWIGSRMVVDTGYKAKLATAYGPNRYGWDDRFTAIQTVYQNALKSRADSLARKRAYEAKIAESKRRREEERERAYRAAQEEWRKQQAFQAAHPSNRNSSQSFGDALNAWGDAMIKQGQVNNRNNSYNGYRRDCYNNYDGTETCFTSKR
ncbi:hypothetical protein [uncultured Spongiibacter sp.]|uniref:hypothetical protein n=1 Tax=uncultured Spongiibacter sp. TaxID=870896 RepID=UPI0025882117|nr:hypothetical protein [uncultured Spongiibacter sp.]